MGSKSRGKKEEKKSFVGRVKKKTSGIVCNKFWVQNAPLSLSPVEWSKLRCGGHYKSTPTILICCWSGCRCRCHSLSCPILNVVHQTCCWTTSSSLPLDWPLDYAPQCWKILGRTPDAPWSVHLEIRVSPHNGAIYSGQTKLVLRLQCPHVQLLILTMTITMLMLMIKTLSLCIRAVDYFMLQDSRS